MRNKIADRKGARELRRAMFPGVGELVSVGIFSVFVNLLMLTGPLFMLQVYDRVLGSRSEETLVALVVLVALLFCLMGILDYARGRIAARIGAAFQSRLDRRVFAGTLMYPFSNNNSNNSSFLRDLEAIQKLFSSQALFALLDIPWAPIFIFAIFVFHPILGWLALSGGVLLIVIAIINQFFSYGPIGNASHKAHVSDALADSLRLRGDIVRGMGMEEAALNRWKNLRDESLKAQIQSSDLIGTFSSLTKTLRFFLQSAILALGAYLVLQGEITAGAMIAASIMLGRALAPIEQTIAQWPIILRALYGWRGLTTFLGQMPISQERTKLPKPRAILEVNQVTVLAPESNVAILRIDNFTLEPGIALGVIGSSASGKSTLARALMGIQTPAFGKIRLDGASIDQYGQDLGRHIGYLPQDVSLFDATIAENISRMAEEPNSEAVVKAAKRAGAHELILKLPNGYDSIISNNSGRLSGGEKQRIGLARAMYGDPVLLVLDEPNSNLDNTGTIALNTAIKKFKSEGSSVIIMAHRPSGIAECDILMVLQAGVQKAFGPRDEVLRAQVQNYTDVSKTIRPEHKK